ncbi:hypothetical protein BGZ95_008935 [Linnemannia exigua]|uniref:Uncharacterized protein n=1 Tax=Linnemannia exigua TaxID=604196 RepID=A0AAD4DDH9_9FUNG|nr:hypothetical protein BGZ95_008935 [Linnemannia exigua]
MPYVYHGCGLIFGPDPAEFITSLTRLELALDRFMDNYVYDEDVTRISDSLRDLCPKLAAFVLQETIDGGLKATLIEYLVDSITRHASTLETLRVFNTNDDSAGLDLLSYYLCNYLPIVACYAELGQDIVNAIKTSTWRCHKLEVLDVHIGDPSEEAFGEDVSGLDEVFEDEPILGWHYHREASVLHNDKSIRLPKAFVQGIFEAVSGLYQLR